MYRGRNVLVVPKKIGRIVGPLDDAKAPVILCHGCIVHESAILTKVGDLAV